MGERTAKPKPTTGRASPPGRRCWASPVTNKRVGYGRAVSGGGVAVMVEVGVDVDRRHLINNWV
jgi:hypothetical protein